MTSWSVVPGGGLPRSPPPLPPPSIIAWALGGVGKERRRCLAFLLSALADLGEEEKRVGMRMVMLVSYKLKGVGWGGVG